MADIIANVEQWFSVGDNLRELSRRIILLEQMIRDPDVARAIAQDVWGLRTNYETARERYTFLYRAAWGSAPEGLEGLGVLPTLPVWVVATLALVASGVLAMLAYAAVVMAQGYKIAQEKEARTSESFTNAADEEDKRAAALDAQGKKAEADAARQRAATLRAQAVAPPDGTGSDLSAFLEKNWPWVLAGGAAALYAVKAL